MKLLLAAATTGYQTRAFADAARRLGVDLLLATDRCHILDNPWGDQALPVRFDRPGESVGGLPPFDAVAAVGDRPAYLAALIAERRGVAFHPPAAVAASRNKFEARERFRAAGLPVPDYFRVPLDEPPAPSRAPYPCVLKPLGLNASRGVIRADDEAAFTAAFHRIRAILDAPEIARFHDPDDRYIQVERFIPGREFALEGLVTRGRLQTLALFDKPDPLDGPYFEETIYVTPSREPEPVQRAIEEAAQRAVTALGLWQGPVHAEMRVNADGVWMLEVAARPIGGLCAKALVFELAAAGAVPLEELILRHALGEDVSTARLAGAASGVMMIPIPRAGVYRGVRGVEAASELAETLITAVEGQPLLPLPEGHSYLGFLFARGDSAAAVESDLRRAHERLTFDLAPLLPVLPAG